MSYSLMNSFQEAACHRMDIWWIAINECKYVPTKSSVSWQRQKANRQKSELNLVLRKHKGEALTPGRWNRGESVELLQKLWDKCCSFHLYQWGKWGFITLKTQGFQSERHGSWTHVCASRPFPLTLLSFFPRFWGSGQELCKPLNHLRWKKFCVVVSLSW